MKLFIATFISLSLCVSVADAGLFQRIKARKCRSCRRTVQVEVSCEKEQCDAGKAPIDQTFAPYKRRVLTLVNEHRTRRGLTTLTLTKDRTVEHSRSQAGRKVKWHASGFNENIYWGSDSPDRAVDWWMNSPGHRRNILHSDNETMGIGKSGKFWTQRFYRRTRI